MRKCLSLLLILVAQPLAAGEVTVAVASNFLTAAEELAGRFEADTGHQVVLSHGSTGQLYAQIDAGAPYDIFLSADAARPAELKQSGKATDVRPYALGRLVLVSRVPVDQGTAPEVFAGRTAALADPTVAPYGLAATSAMEKLKLDTATFRPVLVSNVGQVATVFVTGNADLAFVSAAQLPLLDAPFVLELSGLHRPIVQDAALLAHADGNEAADAFWAWIFTEYSRAVISASGYDLPE